MNLEPYEPTDRRPINSRNTGWAKRISSALVNANISPNSISVFGMLAAIGAGVLFGSTMVADGILQRSCWFAGGLCCQIRLLCNLFDGMVAVEQQTASPVGELYNEVPDRVSDAAIFIGIGFAVGGNALGGVVAALLAVFTAYVRATAKSVGAPNDFCGPMAKPQRMALVTLLAVYMTFTPVAWHQVPESQFLMAPTIVLGILIVGCALTSIRRLARASQSLRNSMADHGEAQ
ncbi:MAG: phosphatidylglycerophosphate synthase [Mariniblastus sp.]|jgi:phosphatidylglycerophosphate synthase